MTQTLKILSKSATSMSKKGCKQIKLDNKQCQAWAMTDSDFCFMHDPAMEIEKRNAVIKGGRAQRRNRRPLPVVEIKDTKSVANLLSLTITEVRRGEVDLRVANCVGYLSGHLIKALEISDLGERVTELEEVLAEKELVGARE